MNKLQVTFRQFKKSKYKFNLFFCQQKRDAVNELLLLLIHGCMM